MKTSPEIIALCAAVLGISESDVRNAAVNYESQPETPPPEAGDPTPALDKGHLRNLLNETKHEIVALRRQNEILRAKVEVMDLFACVLHTAPATREQPMSPDVVWGIERAIANLQA